MDVLKRLCAPNLGEDEYDAMTWDTLPVNWPNHLDEAVTALNHRILPALKFSPKELLLGQIVNTPRTDITESTSALRPADANAHMAYVGQQQLDGYDATVRHAIKRKKAFDKRVLAHSPREVIFTKGQLVQFFHSSLHNTLEAKRKIRLETLEGEHLTGEFHARRLRVFIPREGTKLAEEQTRREAQSHSADEEEETTDESREGRQCNGAETEINEAEEEYVDGEEESSEENIGAESGEETENRANHSREAG